MTMAIPQPETQERMVYASRLERLPVLDPEGAPLGRVDDVVVGSPTTRHAPAVLGFVVAVPGRKIFVAGGRVLEIAADGLRLATGALNLRRFANRPGEVLVMGDLIDQPLPGTSEVVNDIGIQPAQRRARGWEIAVVDLAAAGRRGRATRLHLPGVRRRARRTVGWTEVRALFPTSGDRHAHLRELHPVEVAAHLAQLPPAERFAAARVLDDEQLADLLEELDEDDQAEILGRFDTERAADVLEAMAPDDAADLLGELDSARRRELLAAMEPEEAEPLRRLLRYSGDTAGGLMNPEPVALPPTDTVASALALLRDPDLPAAMAGQVFVVEPPTQTPTGTFRGTCTIQRLLSEAPGTALSDCVSEEPEPIAPSLGETGVAVRLAAYNLLALPVCDADRRLLGAVTIDDVLDRVLPEGWRG